VEQALEQGRRRRPGGGATDRQERFVRLIEQGISNAEACRMVGINRRTGTRWRFGRTIQSTAGLLVHYPPVSAPRPPKPRHPRYLSAAERTTIADLHREEKTLQEIAVVIGRSTSTISRELRRNADPTTGRYLPATADRLAAARVGDRGDSGAFGVDSKHRRHRLGDHELADLPMTGCPSRSHACRARRRAWRGNLARPIWRGGGAAGEAADHVGAAGGRREVDPGPDGVVDQR